MRIRSIFARVARPIAEWRDRRAAYDELAGLDDHMLADIGICRGDIPGIVTGLVEPGENFGAPVRNANDNQPRVAA
jgi:uncharacterized protein YjiS (DUF1127 family)